MSEPESSAKPVPAAGSHHYRYLEHTADTGILAWGETLADAFEAAAIALTDLLCEIETVREQQCERMTVKARDRESLLVEWLNEINFRFEADHQVFSRFEIEKLADAELTASAWGEPLDPERHHPGEQVKAVTYHELRIDESPDRCEVQVILDI